MGSRVNIGSSVKWRRARAMKRCAAQIGTAAAIVLANTSGATAAPADLQQYRAQVDALCRSYIPEQKREGASLAAAYKAGDNTKLWHETGIIMAVFLQKSSRIQAVVVPPDGQAAMAKPLQLLRTEAVYAHGVIHAYVANDVREMVLELARIAKMTLPLNQAFDAVGLPNCVSNQ